MEPTPVEAAEFFEFIGGSGLSVVLVSVHPIHTFNRSLSQQLRGEHRDLALGTIDLRDLLVGGGPALRVLHEGLRACGAPSFLGVLPGYCLFRGGQMLAWDAGLPTFADLEAIGRSAVFGALWSGVTRDLAFVGQALHMATEQVAAHRVAARFRHAVADEGPHRQASGATSPPPRDDVYWAYQMLGVPPTATDREVHDAWRRRRVENHPDRVATDPVEFERRSRLSADINRARDIITEHRSGRTRAA